MEFVETPAGKLSYRVKGSGPVLVLLHGLSRSSSYWRGLDDRLASHFKIVTVDFRGSGKSSAVASWSDRTLHYADDIAQILTQQHIPAAHIFGISMGGMVALTFAKRYPQKTLSIQAANSSIAGTGKARISLEAAVILLLQLMAPTLFTPLLVHLCSGKLIGWKEKLAIAREWKEIAKREPFSYSTSFKQLYLAIRFHTSYNLGTITTPTLILYGRHDRFVPMRNSIALHGLLPNATLYEFPTAGHEILLDQPKELERTIVDFVTSGYKQCRSSK